MRYIIFGLAGAGKDTTASILQHLIGGKITRFAETIKEAALEVFGEEFDKRETKTKKVIVSKDSAMTAIAHAKVKVFPNISGIDTLHFWELAQDTLNKFRKDVYTLEISSREFQQAMGTEIFRATDKDVWANKTKSETEGDDIFIIADGRVLNEILSPEDELIYVFRTKSHEELVELGKHTSEQMGVDLYHAAVLLDTGTKLDYLEHEFYVMDNISDLNELCMNVMDYVTVKGL